NLVGLVISSGVVNISGGAFASCYSLPSITIPGSVVTIGTNAFDHCTNLSSVIISASVPKIGTNAFRLCTSLTSVIIPNSVTNINSFAFASCSNLFSVYFMGNAPSANSSVFTNDLSATVYYLLGTAGWGSTFGGRPTAVWQPKILTTDTSFGVQTNQFGFNISWANGEAVVVEACTDLSKPVWQPLQTNTLIGGVAYFSDSQATNYPSRFYRISSQ
ncbi:MAG TPA: leucine-rich repeat domain-containing protein, partial [Candidatus Acidoferrales bacterium]|nr:leucine-rich repeat domain-containing protein [Candidatus Acidoferrales bacterium]